MKKATGFFSEQRGQVAMLALIALALGSILATAFLSLGNSSLKLSVAYDMASQRQNAAEAGLEWGLWGAQTRGLSGSATTVGSPMMVNDCEVRLTIAPVDPADIDAVPENQRVYTITSTATDNGGKTTTLAAYVCIPYDMWDYAIVSLNGDINLDSRLESLWLFIPSADPRVFADVAGEGDIFTNGDINIFKNQLCIWWGWPFFVWTCSDSGFPSVAGDALMTGSLFLHGGGAPAQGGNHITGDVITDVDLPPGWQEQIDEMDQYIVDKWIIGTPVAINDSGTPGGANLPVSPQQVGAGVFTYTTPVRFSELTVGNNQNYVFNSAVYVGDGAGVGTDDLIVQDGGSIVIEEQAIATPGTISMWVEGDLEMEGGSLVFNGSPTHVPGFSNIYCPVRDWKGPYPMRVDGDVILHDGTANLDGGDIYCLELVDNDQCDEDDKGRTVQIDSKDWGTLLEYSNADGKWWIEAGTPTRLPCIDSIASIVDASGSPTASGTPSGIVGQFQIGGELVVDPDSTFFVWGADAFDLDINGGPVRVSSNLDLDMGNTFLKFLWNWFGGFPSMDFDCTSPIEIVNGNLIVSSTLTPQATDAIFDGMFRLRNGNMTIASVFADFGALDFRNMVFLDRGDLLFESDFQFFVDFDVIFRESLNVGGDINLSGILDNTDFQFGDPNVGDEFDTVNIRGDFDMFGGAPALQQLLAGSMMTFNSSVIVWGQLIWGGAGTTGVPWYPVIASFFDGDNVLGGNDAIRVEGMGQGLQGIMYAPNGEIEFAQGNIWDPQQIELEGSCIGESVRILSGANFLGIFSLTNSITYPVEIRNQAESLVGRASGQDSTVIFSWGGPAQ